MLVQHLDPQHPSALTQLLARATALPVQEITQELRVEPDHVYVIAPDTGLGIEGGVLRPHARAPGRAPNRSVDVFFEALAADQHERAIGVILSGAPSDGTLGLEAIKAEGGITFAQDESARYDSMPHRAVAAGCVDFVLAPQHIAGELAGVARHPYVTGAAAAESRAGRRLQQPRGRPRVGRGAPGRRHVTALGRKRHPRHRLAAGAGRGPRRRPPEDPAAAQPLRRRLLALQIQHHPAPHHAAHAAGQARHAGALRALPARQCQGTRCAVLRRADQRDPASSRART